MLFVLHTDPAISRRRSTNCIKSFPEANDGASATPRLPGSCNGERHGDVNHPPHSLAFPCNASEAFVVRVRGSAERSFGWPPRLALYCRTCHLRKYASPVKKITATWVGASGPVVDFDNKRCNMLQKSANGSDSQPV